MPLPKYLRPRWRYLAVEIEAPPGADLDRNDFQARVWEAARDLLGDPGSADADCSVVRFSSSAGYGEAIVRARRDEVGPARAALACVDAVAGTPVGIRVAGVSGTVRACEEKYINGPTKPPEDRDVAFGSERRPAVVRGDAVDVLEGDTFTGATILDTEEH